LVGPSHFLTLPSFRYFKIICFISGQCAGFCLVA
jgi:hypothetical protein